MNTLEMSEQINELAGAMVKAQKVMKPAAKDASNPYFKSKYSDIAAIWDACREALTDNGIAVLQPTEGDGETIIVVNHVGAHQRSVDTLTLAFTAG